MSKFNKQDTRTAAGQAPVTTATRPTGITHEGRLGYTRDAKGELFLLAVSNLVSQDTFYERAAARDDRFTSLVHDVAIHDPNWMKAFITWLRNDGNMRSASVVASLEAACAMLRAEIPFSRALIGAALQRADEPGEALAYWLAKYGRKIPVPVKRGIADGALRLYNEYALLKYDTASHGIRFADVIELTHPGDNKASQHFAGDWQRDLFKLAIDRRHNRDNAVPDSLKMIRANVVLRALAGGNSPGLLDDAGRLKAAGMTWEDVLSLAGPTVPKKDLWEALIPTMGYMALLRNLRNFDQASVSDEVADQVVTRLVDPEQVAKSRQFPFRFYAAYKAVQSLRWGHTLERALNLSLSNVPQLRGRTLILVDLSPSMFPNMGYSSPQQRSDISNVDLAVLFGSALAHRNQASSTLVGFGHENYRVPVAKGGAVLKTMGQFRETSGTDSYGAAHDHLDGHDRIVVVTDGENNGYRFSSYAAAGVPASTPIYTWNIGGYKLAGDPGAANRHTFAGMTDAAFKMIPLLEAGRDGAWPWESGSTA